MTKLAFYVALLAFLLAIAISIESHTTLAQTGLGGQPHRNSPRYVDDMSDDPSADVNQLRADLSKTNDALLELRKKVDKPPKDIWDKMSAVSGLLSGVLIAIIGIYATQAFNRRQLATQDLQKARELRVLEVQTVEKFFPYLSSNDNKSRTAALVAIAALGNEVLATKLAHTFADVGSREALSRFASSFASDAKQGAESALADLFSALRASVVMVGDPPSGTGYFVSGNGLLLTSAHVLEVPMRSTERDQRQAPPTLLRTFDDKILQARILAIDSATETAVLQASVTDPVPALRARQSALEVGASAIAVGMINGKWEARSGRVTGLEVSLGNHSGLIAVQMDTGPGFAGAPVIDVEGSLIGMGAYADGAGTAYLVPVAHVVTQIQSLLNRRQ